MSKVETPASPEVKTVKKTYTGYDENLNFVSKEVTVTIPEVANNDEALVELSRINDFKAAANYLLKREALSNARKEAGLSGGISSEVVNETVKSFRSFPQFAAMVDNESDLRKIPADKWNAQTKAILFQLKQIPGFIDNIKAASAARLAESDES